MLCVHLPPRGLAFSQICAGMDGSHAALNARNDRLPVFCVTLCQVDPLFAPARIDVYLTCSTQLKTHRKICYSGTLLVAINIVGVDSHTPHTQCTIRLWTRHTFLTFIVLFLQRISDGFSHSYSSLITCTCGATKMDMICNGLIEFTWNTCINCFIHPSIHLLSNSEEGPLAPSECITVSVAISLLKSRPLKTLTGKKNIQPSSCFRCSECQIALCNPFEVIEWDSFCT